ncbi:MAG TPA: TadE/TadG family type IV pilus assembly protein [Candidatus Binatia bacterium]|nr:TadE/TadG family type IV pilus assembly protein [Candidatus Binatia bacterium]
MEISLMTPLLLIALYIPVDFGIAFYMANLTQNAVREGARIGSGLGTPFGDSEATTVKNAVLSRMPSNSSYFSNRSVTVKFYDGVNCMAFVEVSATGTYNFFLYQLMRFFGLSAPDTVPITRQTLMRYNYQAYSNTTACTTVATFGPFTS